MPDIRSRKKGDGSTWNTNLTAGHNFVGGKGNVTVNVSASSRSSILHKDREFSRDSYFDSYTFPSSSLVVGGSSATPATTIYSGALSSFSPIAGATFDSNGNIIPLELNDSLYNNTSDNFLQNPQEKIALNFSSHYKLNDVNDVNDVNEVYANVNFAENDVENQVNPVALFQRLSFPIDGNPFLPSPTQSLLSDFFGQGIDSDGDGIDDDGSTFLRRRMSELGNNRIKHSLSSSHIKIGFNGSFGTSKWLYDGYYQQGSSEDSITQLGLVNRDRILQAMLPDITADPSGQTCIDPTANSMGQSCVPINIFGEGNISPPAAAFISEDVFSKTQYTMNTISFNIKGDTSGIIDLMGGPISVVVGMSQQKNEFSSENNQPQEFNPAIGFKDLASVITGEYDSNDLYAELYFPFFNNSNGTSSLDLSIAARVSDYSNLGRVNSYNVVTNWTPVANLSVTLKLDSSFNVPNMSNLFRQVEEGFPSGTDPCSANATVQNAAVFDICEATGVPPEVIFFPAITTPASQIRSISGGNELLVEETKDSISLSISYKPSQSLLVKVKYYDRETNDLISPPSNSANRILQTCYDPTDPNGGLGSIACSAVVRRPDGTINYISRFDSNMGRLLTKGIDLGFLWKQDTSIGNIGIEYIGSLLTEHQLPFLTENYSADCVGFFTTEHNLTTSCKQLLPEYKHLLAFNWRTEHLGLNLNWRHIGKVRGGDENVNYAVESINAINYLDFTASYQLSESSEVNVGVNNLLNKKPPILGDNQLRVNTFPGTYDLIGRSFFINISYLIK